MIYKTVSAKTVIAKMFRDLKPHNQDWVADAMEWMGEALEFIGYHAGFDKKHAALKVKDFRCGLPSDFHEPLVISYMGEPLRYSGDVRLFNANRDDSDRVSVSTASFQTNPRERDGYLDGDFRQTSTRSGSEDFYSLKPNYLITSFEKGDIELYYLSFLVDEDGFPMIPDNVYYKQALQWYILRQMLMGGYQHPQFDYQFCDAKWGQYCVSAQNDAAFPSVDKVQNFMEGWLRLSPRSNAFDSFFSPEV